MLGEMTQALCYTYVGRKIHFFCIQNRYFIDHVCGWAQKESKYSENHWKIMFVGIRCERSLPRPCSFQHSSFSSEKSIRPRTKQYDASA